MSAVAHIGTQSIGIGSIGIGSIGIGGRLRRNPLGELRDERMRRDRAVPQRSARGSSFLVTAV
jgi:hypothetical protein